MKYIKFKLRNKTEITLPFEKAQKIIDSEGQIFKITDDKGNWTGKIINKSEIIETEVNSLKERDEMDLEMQRNALEAPIEDEEKLRKLREELVNKYKPDFLK